MALLDHAVKSLLLLLLLSATFLSTHADEVLDTREKMLVRAHDAMVTEYGKIGADYGGLRTVCADIGENKFPDLCVPPEGAEGSNRVYDEESKQTRTIKYDDTRNKGGANALKDLKQDKKLGVKAATELGYKIQPNTPQTDAVYSEMCAARGSGLVFKENSVGESEFGALAASTSWQYFGGQETGLVAQYPATVKTMCYCDTYDPRYRPWYASAVTGPKDMILVLDVSGSMGDENRLEIMKQAAVAQLDTMTFLDFVQVVSYSTDAKSMGNVLLQGTDKNKKKMKEYIWSLESGGSTNGQAGVRKAFDIFKQSSQTTSGCTRIISFLTDGAMNTKAWVDGTGDGTLAGFQSSLGDNNDAHIFTYALGSGARTDELKKMSCNHRGWMAKVADGKPEDLKRAMVGYFEYFANHIPVSVNATARWSDFYIDASGQGQMTTVSLPVFTPSPNQPWRIFRGVIGIDVLASDFGTNFDDNAKADQLRQRSKQCMVYDFTLNVPSNNVENTCEVKLLEPQGTPIPTGATINEVEPDHCTSFFPVWAILLCVFIPLIFIGLVTYWCCKKKKQAVRPNVQVVQQHHMVQHHVVQGHPQQMHMMQPQMMHQQPAAMMMNQQQMMQPQMMHQQPAAMMMNQQQMMQPQMVHQQQMGSVPVVQVQAYR